MFTEPADEAIYNRADFIERAMETKPLDHGWIPSELARYIGHLTTGQVREALAWMVTNSFVISDNRGAWSHYYRRH